LFQPNDAVQLQRLWAVLKGHPPAVHYYLRQHIFFALMNFQATNISACCHELGSSILFGRHIGFSGTSSNLLPLDFGECQVVQLKFLLPGGGGWYVCGGGRA